MVEGICDFKTFATREEAAGSRKRLEELCGRPLEVVPVMATTVPDKSYYHDANNGIAVPARNVGWTLKPVPWCDEGKERVYFSWVEPRLSDWCAERLTALRDKPYKKSCENYLFGLITYCVIVEDGE